MKFDKISEDQSALMFKALSHPIRIWIIKQLAEEEHCVSEFVKAVNVEFATISRHLAKLKKTGLIISRKRDGKSGIGSTVRLLSRFTQSSADFCYNTRTTNWG